MGGRILGIIVGLLLVVIALVVLVSSPWSPKGLLTSLAAVALGVVFLMHGFGGASLFSKIATALRTWPQKNKEIPAGGDETINPVTDQVADFVEKLARPVSRRETLQGWIVIVGLVIVVVVSLLPKSDAYSWLGWALAIPLLVVVLIYRIFW